MTASDGRSLRTDVADVRGVCVVRLVGELDADDTPTVRRLLAEQVLTGTGSLVLDLSELTFIDSAGLAALIAAHKGTQTAGTSLLLAGASPAVAKVLAVTGLDAVLRSAPTVEAAVDGITADSVGGATA